MTVTDSGWSGDDWEKYCHTLLKQRYGTHFQAVPDRHGGDLGIDGFTNTGEVFQCYAAKDPIDDQDLNKKQKAKITRDLKKLADNIAEIRKLISSHDVTCWVLLVPRLVSRDVVEHATSKAEELRQEDLSGVGDDFFARVEDLDSFGAELTQLGDSGAVPLPRPVDISGKASAHKWVKAEAQAWQVLTSKVRSLPGQHATKVGETCTRLVRYHLTGKAEEDQLRASRPELWERLNQQRTQREHILETEQLIGTEDERRTLRNEIEELQKRIESALPQFGGGRGENLAWAIVADWLIRCPLDPVATVEPVDA